MTRLSLTLILGCVGPVRDETDREVPVDDSDVDTDTDSDTDTDTGCPPAAWSWGAENAMTTAEASFIGATPQSNAYTFETPGDLDGDAGNDLYITAHLENDGAGALYFILGGVERVLEQALAGRPALFGTTGYPVWAGEGTPLGDINNDGLQDIAQETSGRAYVIFGRTGAWPLDASWADAGASMNNNGYSFGTFGDRRFWRGDGGDYDGDGGDDLLLRAVGPNAGLHGLVGTDVVGDLHLSVDSTTWLTGTGADASGSGDFDGDGRTDVVLRLDTGGCQVVMADDFAGVYGIPASDVPNIVQLSGDVECEAVPDLDGDGDDEIVAAADDALYLFTEISVWTSSMSLEGANVTLPFDGSFVELVALADLNGDGLGELGITRTLPESAFAYEDHVFFGRTEWPSALTLDDADIAIETGAPNWYRRHIGGAHLQGDLNGDGYGELVLYENDKPVDDLAQAGRLYVFLGRPTWTRDLTLDQADVVFAGDRALQRIGNTSSLEDVDGDGCDDFITGSNVHQPENTGEVFVLFGQYSEG